MPKKQEAKPREVKGNKLVCPVCGHKEFWTRRSLLNTTGLTFLGLDWANRSAQNYVCNHCGHIIWFLNQK